MNVSPTQIFAKGPELVPSTAIFLRTFPSVLANWHNNIANKLCITKPASKGKLSPSATQRTKI